MKYILDTDTLIYFFKRHPSVVERFSRLEDEDVATTMMNYAELVFGAHNSLRPKEKLARLKKFFSNMRVLPFCHESAHIFAEQKAKLKKEGKIVDDFDLVIGSVALRHQCILVTNNTKHFARLKLKLDNWAE